MARRTVRVRLDAHTDRPWQRSGFKHPKLRQYVRDRRGDIIAAQLTIAQAWLQAGRPRGSQSLGMFEDWADVLGGIFDVANVPAFLQGQESIYESSDVETREWRVFTERWWDTHKDAHVGVRELWRSIDNPDPVDLGLGHGDERALKTKLGRRIEQFRDRCIGRFKIVADRKAQHAQLWHLEQALQTTGPVYTTCTTAANAVNHPVISLEDILNAAGFSGDSSVKPAPSSPVESSPGLSGSIFDRRPDPISTTSEPGEHSEPPTVPLAIDPAMATVRVPFMITGTTRRRLVDIGYADSEIDGMRPQEALDRLRGIQPA
jgi:hypothetical protein